MAERPRPQSFQDQVPYLLPYAPEQQPRHRQTHRIRRFWGNRLKVYGKPNFALLSNDAGMNLAKKVGALLGQEIPPNSKPFANKELRVIVPEIVEERDIYLIHSSGRYPDTALRQHKLQADGAKGRKANREYLIEATLTHSRQDRIDQPGAAQAALGVVKELFMHSSHNPLRHFFHRSHLTAQGALIVVDVHNTKPLEEHRKGSRGIFRFWRGRYQWANLDSAHVLAPEVARLIQELNLDPVVAFPDAGAARRYDNWRKFFGKGKKPIVINKKRPVTEINHAEISPDQEDTTALVKGRDVFVFDDMIDTGETLLKTARKFKAEGARRVIAVATHGVFSKDPTKPISGVDIANDPAIDMIFVTDTVPPSRKVLNQPKIHVVPIAPLIAEVIRRIETKQSIKDLVKEMSPAFEASYMRLSTVNRYRRKAA